MWALSGPAAAAVGVLPGLRMRDRLGTDWSGVEGSRDMRPPGWEAPWLGAPALDGYMAHLLEQFAPAFRSVASTVVDEVELGTHRNAKDATTGEPTTLPGGIPERWTVRQEHGRTFRVAETYGVTVVEVQPK